MPEARRSGWSRWPALFERASGLVYVNVDARYWDRFIKNRKAGVLTPAGFKDLFGRISHEMYHYLQFFGCGYFAAICSDHFDAIRLAVPSLKNPAELVDFLSKPHPVPKRLTQITDAMRAPGPCGLTPLHLIEGCARLFQAQSEDPKLLHGAYLTILACSPQSDLYGRLYRQVSIALGQRALTETLFLGAVALEFLEPHLAIMPLIDFRAGGDGAFVSKDLHEARKALIAAVSQSFKLKHLGTAKDLAVRRSIEHPLLRERWLYHDRACWERDIREAIWGRCPSAHTDFFDHAEIMTNEDSILVVGRKSELDRKKLEARGWLGRLSMHLGDGAMEGMADVLRTDR